MFLPNALNLGVPSHRAEMTYLLTERFLSLLDHCDNDYRVVPLEDERDRDSAALRRKRQVLQKGWGFISAAGA